MENTGISLKGLFSIAILVYQSVHSLKRSPGYQSWIPAFIKVGHSSWKSKSKPTNKNTNKNHGHLLLLLDNPYKGITITLRATFDLWDIGFWDQKHILDQATLVLAKRSSRCCFSSIIALGFKAWNARIFFVFFGSSRGTGNKNWELRKRNKN